MLAIGQDAGSVGGAESREGLRLAVCNCSRTRYGRYSHRGRIAVAISPG